MKSYNAAPRKSRSITKPLAFLLVAVKVQREEGDRIRRDSLGRSLVPTKKLLVLKII